MISKLLKQLAVCTGFMLALYLSGQSDIPVIRQANDAMLDHMKVNYTPEDLRYVVGKIIRFVSEAGAVDYGPPIDQKYMGTQTPVYAVAGGQITAAGENEEIGKYVKIVHGDGAESLYGNLKSISVSVPDIVRKGQIIGVYEDIKDKEFYYSLKELR